MFTQSNTGKFVVHVEWKDYFNSPDQVQLFVKCVATNHIVHANRQSKYFEGSYTKVEFDNLQAGDYELTLHDIARPIEKIHLCSSKLIFNNTRYKILINFDLQMNFVSLWGVKCSTKELLAAIWIWEKCFWRTPK